MKIKVSNLGAIKQAEFELGELTIICGGNNTGKTYVTHAVYGLLDYLRSNMNFFIGLDDVGKLFEEGTVTLSLLPYIEKIQQHIKNNVIKYQELLATILAGSANNFKSTSITIEMPESINFEESTTIKNEVYENKLERFLNKKKFIESSIDSNNNLKIKFIKTSTLFNHIDIQKMIQDDIFIFLMEKYLPRPFLSSAERTGASMFQKELDFTRNRLIDILQTNTVDSLQLLGKFSATYPLAVRRNIDFIRELPNITNKQSYIAQKHPEILNSFKDIIGGDYQVSKEGEIGFQPNATQSKLSLTESSSAVRSLLDIGFYLRHIAQLGDLLMVDEPELNLHPENQRRVARLFAQLVNVGVKVFITTHSDYIIKELNTLIMFNQGGERLTKLAEQEGYQPYEFLEANKVRVYIAEEALIKPDCATRWKRCQTLVPANIDEQYGIEARSFDTTIETMNRIQEEIVWGE